MHQVLEVLLLVIDSLLYLKINHHTLESFVVTNQSNFKSISSLENLNQVAGRNWVFWILLEFPNGFVEAFLKFWLSGIFSHGSQSPNLLNFEDTWNFIEDSKLRLNFLNLSHRSACYLFKLGPNLSFPPEFLDFPGSYYSLILLSLRVLLSSLHFLSPFKKSPVLLLVATSTRWFIASHRRDSSPSFRALNVRQFFSTLVKVVGLWTFMAELAIAALAADSGLVFATLYLHNLWIFLETYFFYQGLIYLFRFLNYFVVLLSLGVDLLFIPRLSWW